MSRKATGVWEYVPGTWFDDPTSPDGRRFVATRAGWSEIRRRVYMMDRGRCQGELCGRRAAIPLTDGHVHHVNLKGRGLGGSVRDDRIFIPQKDGSLKRNLLWVCPSCHDRIERPEKVVPAKELPSDVCACSAFRDQHPHDRCREFRLSRRATRLDIERRSEIHTC